ncbi:MAG: glutaminase [Gammaproteobacteria bacterium]|jgi:glutaminase
MNLQTTLSRVYAELLPQLGCGRVADYIPALARVDPRKFGMAIVTVNGQMAAVGDAQERFSIQSVSKVFSLALALGQQGNDLWQRVGREPSGSAFNSIVQLENEHGIPRNPFINAGAIVVSDVLIGTRARAVAQAELLAFVRSLATDRSINIDAEVARSEAETGDRNRALAYYMESFGNIKNDVDAVLDLYFKQCALSMSCVELARAGLFLAADGRDPLSGHAVVRESRARRINALMLTCGHYDASGDFAFQVGLPGKSGVGGGILAVAPGHAAMAVWSPGLNANGNSALGSLALERLAQATGWTVFR